MGYVEAAVRQSSILRTLLFMIRINDLSDNLSSNPKLFTADILLSCSSYKSCSLWYSLEC